LFSLLLQVQRSRHPVAQTFTNEVFVTELEGLVNALLLQSLGLQVLLPPAKRCAV
jgi:hypothetical protein